MRMDLLNIRPKVTLKGPIGAIIYLLYKWFYHITGYFICGFYCTIDLRAKKTALVVAHCSVISVSKMDLECHVFLQSLKMKR